MSHLGDGLPEELVHQMFDRGDVRTKSQEGLGLSMCQKLVRLMNGEVRYEREKGKCHFVMQLELPIAQADDAASVQ